MNFLGEAFKRLSTLQEDTFDITDKDIAELEDVVVGTDEDDTIDIIDDEVETFEELQPSYVGKVILDCNVCHSLVYKDKADVVISDDGEDANIDEECPYCMSTDGFKIVGEVAPFEEEKEEIKVEVDEEPIEVEEGEVEEDKAEEEVEIEESLTEAAEVCPGCGKDKEHCECEDKELEECGNPIMTEDFQDVSITTEDQKLEMTSDEDGKVTVTTEPIEHEEEAEEEMIVPVDAELEAEIEEEPIEEEPISEEEFEDEFVADEDGDVEVDLEDVDEESIDEVTESYLKEVYENVKSFKTTEVSQTGNTLRVEGVIGFNSGKERKTAFLFEATQITKRGKVKLVGMNESITRGRKPYTITGTISNKQLVVESFNYNYRQKDEKGNSVRLYNTCKRSK